MSRPTKFTASTQAAIVAAVAVGATRADAAAAAGVHPATLASWTRRHAGFRAEVERAEGEAAVRMTGVLARAAVGGSWRAGLAWLERRRPNEWGPRAHVELEVATVAPAAMRDIERYAAELGVDVDEVLAEAEALARRMTGRMED